MADCCADCGMPQMYCLCKSSSAVFPTGSSAIKGTRCLSCGRDTSQPNLLPQSLSRSCEYKQHSSGTGICRQCGGLGAGLLTGI